jgi:hypothetical protein
MRGPSNVANHRMTDIEKRVRGQRVH